MYRLYIPHLHVPDSLFLFRMGNLDLKELRDYPVVVVQRQVTPQNYKALKMLKDNGKKIIYDLDDDVYNLPVSNPAQKLFQMMEKGFGECMKWVDVITVSTQTLKSVLRAKLGHLRQEILVTPNAIDFDMFRPSYLDKDDGRIILGWAGSNTHDGDMGDICEVLPELLKKYPNLYIEFVGGLPPKNMRAMERVSHRQWVPVGEFANRFSSWAWDISMAPLDDNRFNRSKSCIKLLEAAAVKIPCLVSNVRPYSDFCALGGKELEWLVCNMKSEWRSKLEMLIEDVDRRKSMADLTYDIAKKYYSADIIAENWKYAIRTAAEWN